MHSCRVSERVTVREVTVYVSTAERKDILPVTALNRKRTTLEARIGTQKGEANMIVRMTMVRKERDATDGTPVERAHLALLLDQMSRKSR